MESKEELHALISAYLAGALTEEERKSVEDRCEKDAEFADIFRLQTQAEYVVYANARDKKREELNQMFDLMQRHGEISKGNNNIRWIVGVVIAATAAILLLFFWPDAAPDTPSDLYSEYIVQNTPELSFKRIIKPREDTLNESMSIQTWENAAQAFNEQDYSLSQQLISEVLEDTAFVQRETAQYFLGLSYLFSVDPEKEEITITDHQQLQQAINSLEKVDPAHLYKESAIWYTALAYLKLEDLAAAKEQLNRVLEFNSHYRESEARDLLNRLAE